MTDKDIAIEKFREKYGAFELCDIVNKKDMERLEKYIFETIIGEAFKSISTIEIDNVPNAFKNKETEQVYIDTCTAIGGALKKKIKEEWDINV